MVFRRRGRLIPAGAEVAANDPYGEYEGVDPLPRVDQLTPSQLAIHSTAATTSAMDRLVILVPIT